MIEFLSALSEYLQLVLSVAGALAVPISLWSFADGQAGRVAAAERTVWLTANRLRLNHAPTAPAGLPETKEWALQMAPAEFQDLVEGASGTAEEVDALRSAVTDKRLFAVRGRIAIGLLYLYVAVATAAGCLFVGARLSG